MGIYFIAAGSTSKNREKSLEKGFRKNELQPYIPSKEMEIINNCYDNNEVIYLWGANSENECKNLNNTKYVVDVKNKKVVQIFTYCHRFKTKDTRLQEFVGWDSEKSKDERRLYLYVYFLKNPQPTSKKEKDFFKSAFGFQTSHWLQGQKYFSDNQVHAALLKTNSPDIETFLGIKAGGSKSEQVSIPSNIDKREDRGSSNNTILPDYLKPIADDISVLKKDPKHMERDHEHIVARFFELLGYKTPTEIKYQRGRIDIIILNGQTPYITIEVKKDWTLSNNNTKFINQAFNYANEVGSRYVILTNGDVYFLYDQMGGLSYNDKLLACFTLSNLDKEGLEVIKLLSKET